MFLFLRITISQPETRDGICSYTSNIADAGKGVTEIIFDRVGDCEKEFLGTAFDEGDGR